jgi:hypothetical protein
MMDLGLWITPLLLLPGVALLVMSTSLRYNRLHDELHHLESALQPEPVAAWDPDEDGLEAVAGSFLGAYVPAPDLLARCAALLRRGRMFRDALVALYSAAGLFTLAALAGGLLAWHREAAWWVVIGLSGFGIACVLFAAVQLVRESLLSFAVLESHAEELAEALGLDATAGGPRALP